MAKQSINVSTANSGLGDPLRTAFVKINSNFTELYAALGLDAGGLNLGAFQFSGSIMSTTDSTPMVLNQAVSVTGDLTVGGDLLPNNDLQVNLGSPSKKWHSLYVGTGSVYIGDAKLSLEGGTLNSSVGFSTDSLIIGGNVLTVNEAGVLQSTGGISGGAGGNATDRITANGISIVVNGNGTLVLPATDTELINTAIIGSTANIQLNSNGHYWLFDTDGNLTLPTNGSIFGNTFIGNEGINVRTDFTTGEVYVDTYDAIRGWSNEWTFTTDGTLSHGGSLYVDGTIEARYGNQLQLQGSFFTRHSTTVQFSNADGTAKDSYIANSGYWSLSGITNPNVFGATVYDNGTSYSTNGPVTAAVNNDHTFTFGSVFTLQANTSYTLDWWEYNPQSVKLNGGENTWEFKPDGSAQLPNYVKQNTNPSVICNIGMDTVVYTGSDQYLHTFKLLIKVEGHEVDAMTQWETQSTEMIIAKSFNGDKVTATAYGVVHTSIDPLATFTARWNPTISRVEVLCRPTSLTYPVDVRTFATEIFTSD